MLFNGKTKFIGQINNSHRVKEENHVENEMKSKRSYNVLFYLHPFSPCVLIIYLPITKHIFIFSFLGDIFKGYLL